MKHNIKCAIFDMDGTLVDSLMVWDVLWENLGKEFLNHDGFRPAEEDDRAVRTMTLKDAMEHIHNVYNAGESGAALLDFANNMMVKFYGNDVKLKLGVREFLDYLLENGIRMCIASATDPKLVRIAMKSCEIEKYFSHLFSCADIGKGKEEPDIYIMALEKFGASKEETWVFEDSAVAIQTAHSIGLPTVGIYDKYNYGHDIIEKLATVYIADGETLEKLISE